MHGTAAADGSGAICRVMRDINDLESPRDKSLHKRAAAALPPRDTCYTRASPATGNENLIAALTIL